MNRLLVPLLCMAFASPALAWREPQRWHESASGAEPGGGGIIGTGGPGDSNVTCAACHTAAQGLVGASTQFEPPIVAGAYAPGQTYTVTVRMSGEHLGLGGCASANANGFAARFQDASGSSVGLLASDGNTSASACQATIDPSQLTGTSVVYGDCKSVEALATDSATQWSFAWAAPVPGSGPVTLSYGVVDGNCAGDSLGDDVKIGVVYLGEAQALAAPPRPNRALAWLAIAPAVAAAIWQRRRKRRA